MAAGTCSPKVKMPGFCSGTRAEHAVLERELTFCFLLPDCLLATEGDHRHGLKRLKCAG